MDLDWEREEPRDNVVAGTVGAFLGSLIGVACIVLVSKLGYVAAVCGMVMAVCSIKGYTLLGGRFSKRGAVISGLLILVMTYIANKLCFALAVMEVATEEVGFFFIYRSIGRFLEDGELRRIFLGELAMLYLFTLVGSVPVLVSAFRDPAGRAASRGTPAPEDERPQLQAEFYSLDKKWMRPLRLSVCIPVLLMMLAVLGGWMLSAAFLQAQASAPAAIGGFLSVIVLACLTFPVIRLCNTYHILFVRAGGRLWRVDLQKHSLVQDWEKLPASRQTEIKRTVLQEIQLVLEGRGMDAGAIFQEMFPGFQKDSPAPEGQPDRAHRRVVLDGGRSSGLTPLEDLRVEKEDRWSWKISYQAENGSRKKLTIPKGYPGLSPAPGLTPSQGPVPARWTALPALLLLTVGIIGAGWGIGLLLEGGGPVRDQPQEQTEGQPEVPAEVTAIPARTPENITEYEMSEVWFQVDGDFKYSRRTFLDGDAGTLYRAYVQYGVDASDAWDTLSQYIGTYRTSPLYDRFDAVYLGQDLLAPLNEASRYNIVSVYLTDGQAFHTASVLSDDGALFTIEARQDASDRSEDVLANLMFTLESVRFDGPAVTEENYQSQIHVSAIRDCTYMAAAYLKTDLFGHDAFVDVYVPYSDAPIYSAGGRAIRTEAHGLRVYATIVPGENAKEVIDARQRELAATGQVYAEGADDEMYREDLDAACKLTVYEENGQKRQAVLYADSKWEGYYLLREITGLPELVDGEYSAALQELEGIIGLTMPVLEALGGE